MWTCKISLQNQSGFSSDVPCIFLQLFIENSTKRYKKFIFFCAFLHAVVCSKENLKKKIWSWRKCERARYWCYINQTSQMMFLTYFCNFLLKIPWTETKIPLFSTQFSDIVLLQENRRKLKWEGERREWYMYKIQILAESNLPNDVPGIC